MTSQGPTSCFCWASKLLSGTSEAPQTLSVISKLLSGTFSAPLKTLKSFKFSSSFRRPFAALPWELPRPRPHELFLLGCETAIWHFRSATSCFYWASKLLSGTFSAPLKTHKTFKTLPAAFDGLSLLCHGTSRGPTSCFCWASKLLSGTSEAPQAVSIGLRNCYLARFQHPLKPSKPSKPSQQLSTAFRCFCHGTSRGRTSCFCWASKLLSGTSDATSCSYSGLRTCCLARFQLKTLKGFKTFPAAFGFYWALKLLSGTFCSTS